MSSRRLIAVALLSAVTLCAAPRLALAQDATVQQIYQTAQAGRMAEAQTMMDQVLRDHPNSGRAHYVDAELLARQGRTAEAATELATAERLAPGLPFAKPEAVQQLRTQLARGRSAGPANKVAAPAASLGALGGMAAAPALAGGGGGIPWRTIIVIGALFAVIMFVVRKLRANKLAQQRYAPAAGPVGGAPAGVNPGYPQYGAGPMGPMGPGGPGGSGIGSGIAGGLATGAAVGAGLVAGEELMHHFTDRDRAVNDTSGNQAAPNAAPSLTPDPQVGNSDMGGDDFGITDPGNNWDDSGGDVGADDDWT